MNDSEFNKAVGICEEIREVLRKHNYEFVGGDGISLAYHTPPFNANLVFVPLGNKAGHCLNFFVSVDDRKEFVNV